MGAVLQGEVVQAGQACQQGLQAAIPQGVAVTQVQALQAGQASQADSSLVVQLHTPAHITRRW